MFTDPILFMGCYIDCFYEDENSECLIKGFDKPKDGHCKGQFRCIMCDIKPIKRVEFIMGVEICKDCLMLIETYKKGLH